jgi:EmrB/QacA subfamily drug resistance transporter
MGAGLTYAAPVRKRVTTPIATEPAMPTDASAQASPPTRSSTLALLVAGTFFMEILDGTIIATAAPSMAKSFGVQSAQISVCITAYLLTLAVLIPISGWIADRFGARHTYAVAIVIFTVASALCAVSTNLPELVVMRVLQGLGGAMMVPVGRLVVLRAVAKRDIIRMIAFLTWPALLAPILAPALGGVLATYASWRWIFLINLPLGVIALPLALRLVPRTAPIAVPRLDWVGFFGSALTLGGLVYVADLLGQPRVRWLESGLLAAAVLVIGALTVGHLRAARHPLLDLDLLSIRTFRAAISGGSPFRMSVTAVPFLLPLMFQDGFGWSAARAGTVVLFVFVGNMAIKPLTTPMLQRFGFRAVLVAATFAAALSIAACALFGPDTPVLVIAVIITIGGVFRSIGFTVYNTIAYADVDQPSMNQANTVFSTITQLTVGLGVAASVIFLRIGDSWLDRVPAYRFAFLLLAALALVAFIDACRLPRTAGDELRSR